MNNPEIDLTKEESISKSYLKDIVSTEDYQVGLKMIEHLEALRSLTVKRLEVLSHTKKELMKNPRKLLEVLENGALTIGSSVVIPELPKIDWEKYNLDEIISTSKPCTRQHKALSANKNIFVPKEEILKTVSNHSIRKVNYSKTFNLPWSVEEQQKLEELLIKYPEEMYASRRYAKIANEMGCRNLAQVQSRVQKYFIALKRQGLPVPGKNPPHAAVRPLKRNKRNPFNICYRRSYVYASDVQSKSNYENNYVDNSKTAVQKTKQPSKEYLADVSCSDEEDITKECKASEEYKEYKLYKKIKSLKMKELNTGIIVHYGFKCTKCLTDPLKGIRWHCNQCPKPYNVDICTKCLDEELSYMYHSSSHQLVPVKVMSIEDTINQLLKKNDT